MTQHSLIGLSLSSCVRDILVGHVKLEQVEKIIAGTTAVTDEDWDRLTAAYAKSFWSSDPTRAREIVRELVISGRVEQPRLSGEACYSISQGYWVSRDPGIIDGVQLLPEMPARCEIS